jgi:hypothetical protein
LGEQGKPNKFIKKRKSFARAIRFRKFTISCAMAMAYLDDQPNLEVSHAEDQLQLFRRDGLIDKFALYRIFQKGRLDAGGARISAVIDKLRFIF